MNVAAIDLGSNTIKALVATDEGAGLCPLFHETFEVRIGGPGASIPRERVDAAAEAVRALLDRIAEWRPERIRVVTTSAVRDAANRDEVLRRLGEACGHPVEVLEGTEEAAAIAAGVLADPLLRGQRDLDILDLGGGSLEWIMVRDRVLRDLGSLPVGAVRMLARHVPDGSAPLSTEARAGIAGEVAEKASGWLGRPRAATYVGTGGAFTIARAILAAEAGIPLAEKTILGAGELAVLESRLASMSLAERSLVPGLPASRADILPIALVVINTLASRAGITGFRHSFHNLRAGLCAEMLWGRAGRDQKR